MNLDICWCGTGNMWRWRGICDVDWEYVTLKLQTHLYGLWHLCESLVYCLILIGGFLYVFFIWFFFVFLFLFLFLAWSFVLYCFLGFFRFLFKLNVQLPYLCIAESWSFLETYNLHTILFCSWFSKLNWNDDLKTVTSASLSRHNVTTYFW